MDRLVKAVEEEDRKTARRLKKEMDQQLEVSQNYTAKLNEYISELPEERRDTGRVLLELFYLETLLIHQVERMITIGSTHILNLHKPLETEQVNKLDRMVKDIRRFCQVLPSTTGRKKPNLELERMRSELDRSIELQVDGLIHDKYNYKNSLLYFNLLLRNLESAEILLRMDELAETARPHSEVGEGVLDE